MRTLSPSNGKRFRTRTIVVIALLAEGGWTLGCGAGSTPPPPPPPPPPIGVTVTPATGSVVLGNQLTFTAAVANTTDAAVRCSDNTLPWGISTVETLTAALVFPAPAALPPPATA